MTVGTTQSIAANAVQLAVNGLKDIPADGIDSLAVILNDFDGADGYDAELWVNMKEQVDQKIHQGISERQARWLYEHWGRDGVTIRIIGDDVSDSGELNTWRGSVSREGYYETGVAVASKLRSALPGLRATLIFVDNNHEYEEIVFEAIRAANPEGQADDWLSSPPPDCDGT